MGMHVFLRHGWQVGRLSCFHPLHVQKPKADANNLRSRIAPDALKQISKLTLYLNHFVYVEPQPPHCCTGLCTCDRYLWRVHLPWPSWLQLVCSHSAGVQAEGRQNFIQRALPGTKSVSSNFERTQLCCKDDPAFRKHSALKTCTNCQPCNLLLSAPRPHKGSVHVS